MYLHLPLTFTQMQMEMLERAEIGAHIIDHVLGLVLRNLQKYKEGSPWSREIVATLTSLLTELKPEIVWNFLCQYLLKSVADTPGKSCEIPKRVLIFFRDEI
jgi:hypothetical protein